MKKIFLVIVGLALIGAFLPESETGANPKVAQVKVEKVLTEAEKQEKRDKFYMKQRYDECYGAKTVAHKKNGLQERNRVQAIKIREQVCTAAQTDATITGWNKLYTEVK